MSKRKALIDSDSDDGGSESDLDTELLGLAKQKTSNGNEPTEIPIKSIEAPKPTAKDDTDSETSDSDSDWDVPKNKKRKKEKVSQKSKSKESGSDKEHHTDSELEEGEVAGSSGEDLDGGGSSSSDLEFDDGLDDDLMGGEEDRVRLQGMTEKEREQELFNRIENREVLRTRFEIEKKLKMAKRKQNPHSKRSSSSSSFKNKDQQKNKTVALLTDRKKILEENKAGKNDKFAVLKAKREDRIFKAEEREKKEKETEDRRRRDRHERDGEADSEVKHKLKPEDVFSSEDESGDARSPDDDRDKRRISSSSDSSSSDSDSGSNRSHGSYTSGRESSKPKFITTMEELEKIRVSRYKIEKFVHLPVFAKAVVGCFVRIGIGSFQGRPVYRVAEIIDVVETSKIYDLGKTRTNKGLRLRHGHSDHVFRLEFVSNTCYSQSEYGKWVEACAKHNVSLPTTDRVRRKQKDINDLLHYQFSNEDIDKIIQEKARFNTNPTNFAVAKTLLFKEREEASQQGDDLTVSRVTTQIAELEDKAISLDKKRNSKISSISYINERNRKNNIEKAEKAIIAESEERRGRMEDPFTRRSTRPTMAMGHNLSKTSDELEAVVVARREEERQKISENEIKRSEEAITLRRMEDSRRKDDAGKLRRSQEEMTSHDPFDTHNFDIKIDLDVNTPAVAAPMAPRTTTICPPNGVPAATGAAPKRSLKFEEYKKKKGLL